MIRPAGADGTARCDERAPVQSRAARTSVLIEVTIATQAELIVLVDDDGEPIGSAEKWTSHHARTPLHLGFSCYVFDDDGRFLATRRARSKKVWPGVWSNTVCGHPAPGESFEAAIERRLDYELGMSVRAIDVVLPHHTYRAPAFRGIVEHELCPVFVARAQSPPRANPCEVEDWRWVAWPQFVLAARSDAADVYSWWCKNQLRELARFDDDAPWGPDDQAA